ncbi:hypothetical protein MPLA_660029 [Mesorhizobium sp. ORS 3359]|nr:hypothetical protein MPLA_660029 [Mesorhizobium sp. ORS 3359]
MPQKTDPIRHKGLAHPLRSCIGNEYVHLE